MAIAQELHASAGPRPPYLDRWIALLVEFAPRRAHEFIDYALNACQWPADRQRALLLFDHLTLPRLGLDRLSSFDGSARLTVELPGKDYWLTETWNAFFAPNLAELAHDLMPIVDHHLRLAYRLQALSSRSGFDGLSYARSAIERRDTSETAVGCLIDFARDSLMTQLAVDPELGRGYLHAWSRSDLLLLRRLAVHGWVTRPDVGSDEKLAWLAAQDWLYHRGLRHEVFELMSNALPGASVGATSDFIARVLAGPGDHPDVHADDDIFDFLSRIAWAAPSSVAAAEALATFRDSHSELADVSHIADNVLNMTRFVASATARDGSNIHARIDLDARATVLGFFGDEGSVPRVERPWWNGDLNSVPESVSEYPDDGHSILAVVDVLDDDEQRDVVTEAVVIGWANAGLSEPAYNRIATFLNQTVLTPRLVDASSQFLLDQGRDEEYPWARHSALARSLASTIWQAGFVHDVSEPSRPERNDWLQCAINDWSGRVAQFWTRSVSSEWQADPAAWIGLSLTIKAAIETLILGVRPPNELAQVVVASQLRLLFGADEKWCVEHVLPLLDWIRDPLVACRCWEGFLYWGRFNDRILKAGLLDHFISGMARITALSEQLQNSFAEQLAVIALQSEIDPVDSGFLRMITTKADLATRTRWMHAVGWQVSAEPDFAEASWTRWMRVYWEGRLASLPSVLTVNEASAMAAWVWALDGSFEEGVELVERLPAPFGEHFAGLGQAHALHLAEKYPDGVARLIASLLSMTTGPFHRFYSLEKLMPIIRPRATASSLNAIAEHGLRLGYAGATNWVAD